MTMRRMLLAAALLLPATAGAATAAVVELVQPPAWIVRDGDTSPLGPGAQPRSGDIIRTGERTRLRLGLAEGSDIRIGPAARVELPRLEPAADEGGFFDGLVEVVRGAFRFTTGQAEAEHKRRIDIKVGAVTAGIRGTDIWGKAAADRDFVVLLEGEIEAGSRDRSTRLTEPGTAYIQPKDAPAQPGVAIDADTIAEFARETEPLPERGALTPDGDWVTVLDSLREPDRARAARARYREAGFPVEIEQATVEGQRWYRLVLPGAASRADARALAAELERAFDVRGPWVRRDR